MRHFYLQRKAQGRVHYFRRDLLSSVSGVILSAGIPLTPAAKPGTAPAPATNQPWAIYNKMGLGFTQERFTIRDHDTKNPEYWRYYIDTLGFRQVRLFVPYNPAVQWFNDGSEGFIRHHCDVARVALNAGMPVVILEGADMLGSWTLDHNFVNRMNEHFDTFGRIVAEYNFPTDRFVCSAAAEYGGGTNAEWEPHRFRWNNTLRKHLPAHTLLDGPCLWKGCQAIFDPNFKVGGGLPAGVFNPWPDQNKIIDGHQYLDWDFNGIVWLASEMHRFGQERNTPVISPEFGFGSEYQGNDMSRDIPKWIERIDRYAGSVEIARVKPCLWAFTDGENWRMNDRGTNRVRGELGEHRVIGWTRKMHGLLGQ